MAADWVEADGRGKLLVLHDGSSFSAAMARAFADHAPSRASEPAVVSTTIDDVQLPGLAGYDAVFFAPSSVQSAGRLAVALGDSALPVA